MPGKRRSVAAAGRQQSLTRVFHKATHRHPKRATCALGKVEDRDEELATRLPLQRRNPSVLHAPSEPAPYSPTSMPTVAKGGKLKLWKAWKSSDEALTERLPRKRWLSKKRQTSGMMKWPARMSEPRRLSIASVKSSLSGICAPVRMTVLLQRTV